MEPLIDNLLDRYETGALSRREIVAAIAALTVASPSALAAAPSFECNSINHVSITCRDLSRTVAFYTQVIGLQHTSKIVPNGAELAVGPAQHLSIRPGSPAGIDHFSFGLDKFDVDQLTAALTARGAVPKTEIAAGFHVLDPDGIPVQLIANNRAG